MENVRKIPRNLVVHNVFDDNVENKTMMLLISFPVHLRGIVLRNEWIVCFFSNFLKLFFNCLTAAFELRLSTCWLSLFPWNASYSKTHKCKYCVRTILHVKRAWKVIVIQRTLPRSSRWIRNLCKRYFSQTSTIQCAENSISTK